MERPSRAIGLGLLVLFVCFGTGLTQAVKIRVITDKGYVRLLPDARSSVIKIAPKGAVLASDDLENEWFRVFLPAKETEYNLIGFIHQSEAEKIEAESLIPGGGASAPKERKHPISAKISGGMVYLKGGFPNTVRDYYDQYFRAEAAAATSLVVLQGGIPPLHNGSGAGAEVVLNFGFISLGLGTEYVRAEKTGTMTFGTRHWGPALLEFSIADRLTVIPAKINIYANILKSRIGHVRLYGGAGMYFGTFSDEWSGVNEKGESFYFRQKARAQDIGYQGGVEIEMNLGENFALVAEGLGQLVKINGFSGSAEGSANWFHPKSGITETSLSGTLYIYEMQSGIDAPWIPNLVIFKTAPTRKSLGLNSRENIRNVAEAKIDFSGYSARIGLRIKF
ncbi:MAG: hypothetical protein NTW38_09515 [Candidatus Aminicenantes bacterium]|nr:hypothetical protein [Candidatus Aminicenantes bacterium]